MSLQNRAHPSAWRGEGGTVEDLMALAVLKVELIAGATRLKAVVFMVRFTYRRLFVVMTGHCHQR